MTWFIRIIPVTHFEKRVLDRNGKIAAKSKAGNHKVTGKVWGKVQPANKPVILTG